MVSSEISSPSHRQGRSDAEEQEDNLPTLSKFTLFETHTRFYITATSGDSHRVLKIDRSDPTELSLTEDATVYSTEQLDVLLRMVQDGNKGNGGLEKVCEFQWVHRPRWGALLT